MKKLIILYSTLLVSMLFLVLPKTEPRDWFLFSERQLTFATYLYFILEHYVLIVFTYLIASEAKKYREALNIFLLITVADLVDFLLCYNEVWFRFGAFPVSMNTVSVIVFGFVILKEWKQHIQ